MVAARVGDAARGRLTARRRPAHHEAVGPLVGEEAQAAKSSHERRDAIAFLHAELSRAAHTHLAAVRGERGDCRELVDHAWHFRGLDGQDVRPVALHDHRATGFARLGARDVDLHARAEPPENRDQPCPRRVQPDIVDLDAGAWKRGRRRHPESGRREVAGNRQRAGRQVLAAGERDRPIAPDDLHAKRVERTFGVIAGLGRFRDRRGPLRQEPGQQHRTLHLSARHLRRVCNAVQTSAVNRQRRAAVGRLDSCAHRLEWGNHAAHRAARERGVAHETA